MRLAFDEESRLEPLNLSCIDLRPPFLVFPSCPQTLMKTYSVYIMASKSLNLYTGVTSNLQKRVWQHREKQLPGFSAKYNTNRLVYYESFAGALAAIHREKQIKGWLRSKKVALIESVNRDWKDLSAGW